MPLGFSLGVAAGRPFMYKRAPASSTITANPPIMYCFLFSIRLWDIRLVAKAYYAAGLFYDKQLFPIIYQFGV